MRWNADKANLVPSHECHILAPRGGQLWAERAGAGSPVVLMHGAGMDSRLWDAVAPALARAHTVIRYDARGLGRSSTPTAPFWDVEDLCAVLDHFNLPCAALVGLSMGGETALDFALAHPARVRALALVGTSVSGHNWPHTPQLSAYSAARRQGHAARLVELELSIWAPMGTTGPGGEAIAAMVHDNAQRRIVTEPLALYPSQDAIGRLNQITAPTLIIYGDRDHPEINVIAERLSTEIPNGHCAVLSDADHYLPLRTPERLAELLLAHLS